jgi:hypothetical protein
VIYVRRRYSVYRAIVITALYGFLVFGQEVGPSTGSKVRDYAMVRQERDFVTVTARAPCPIRKAIAGVRTTFGWTIDFEEAPVDAGAALAEDKSPEWRETHPDDPRIFNQRNGFFMSYVPGDKATLETHSGKEAALKKLVADYDASGYPGAYSVKPEGAGRFAVIGRYEGGSLHYPAGDSILDTAISVPRLERNAWDTISTILDALTTASGTPVKASSGPTYTLVPTQVKIGGAGLPARQLLLRTFAATGWPLVWELAYEPTPPAYSMHIHVMGTDKLGRQPLDPVD